MQAKITKANFIKTLCYAALFTVLLAATPLLSSGHSGKKWDTIRVAVEGAYPPFSQTEADGSVTGFDIDIANALCDQLGAKCRLITQEWDGIIPGLLAKKYDAIIASMSITDERKKKVAFTKKYYVSPAAFIGKKNTRIKISPTPKQNRKALSGKRIGVQGATISDNFITENYGDVAQVKRYSKQDEANLDLLAGRLDLVFADKIPLIDFLSKEEAKEYDFIGADFSEEKWFGEGIGIAVRKQDRNLVKQLNEAIVAIKKNGTYDRIRKKYFDFDIYGN